MATRLENKIALITGAAGGIGSCIVKTFIAEGATVLAADTNVEGIRRQSGMQPIGEHPRALDVTREEQWRALMDEIGARWGGFDILVNAAAFLQPGVTLETTSQECWDTTFLVNAQAAFLGIKHSIPLMKGRGDASIVNISSGVAVRASVKAPAYGASKAAVIALTKSTALHCAQNGYAIRANVILPGAVDTPMLRRNIPHSGLTESAYLEKVRATHPLGRIGTPADIAAAALFLASADSSFITGIELPVDGGQTI
jgi:NAD(P)-dependent dehydrogenase (short-subunit alcohol dehydrogenase family)